MLEWADQKRAEDLCKVGKLLAAKNMVHYLLGTISTRISSGPPSFLVKPALCLYETAEPDDFACVDEHGNPFGPIRNRPTSQLLPSLNFLAHVACYRERNDIGAVVHAHPENIVSFISQHHRMWHDRHIESVPLITQEAVWMVKNGYIPVVEDVEPRALAEAMRSKIRTANVVAIRNHGIIAVGKDIWEAYGTALVAESEAAMIARILAMNGEPFFRDEKTVTEDLRTMPPTFSPKFVG